MERHFLLVVDERKNLLGNSNENLLVCSDYTLVGKPLYMSLIESLMSRKANEFLKIFQVYFRSDEKN